MKLTQHEIPGTAPDVAGMLRKRASEPLCGSRSRPAMQLPCDIGLFSDDALQLDLVEMFQEPTNDE